MRLSRLRKKVGLSCRIRPQRLRRKQAAYRNGKPLRHPKTGTELSFPQAVKACGELSAIEKAPHWRQKIMRVTVLYDECEGSRKNRLPSIGGKRIVRCL
jgi:hypothetical protein